MRIIFKTTAAIVLLSILPILSACMSSDNSVEALESVVAEQQKRQREFFDRQKQVVEAQTSLAEEQRKKQLEVIEANRLRMQRQTNVALLGKPSQLAEPKKEKKKKLVKRRKVQKASVGGSSRASGNIKLNAPWKCVPDRLKAVVREVSRRYGTVIVNSTYRSRSKNRRVGGARRSYHLRCQAVDFRVRADGRRVLRFLRSHPHVGGLKRYRSGYFHIDTGPRRTWRG